MLVVVILFVLMLIRGMFLLIKFLEINLLSVFFVLIGVFDCMIEFSVLIMVLRGFSEV